MSLLACLTLLLSPSYVMRVVDADTFILHSVSVPPEERVRVLGVDAVELRDSLGPAARAFTQEWLARGPFWVQTCKRDSFGRLLGIVWRGPDTLATALINARLGEAR